MLHQPFDTIDLARSTCASAPVDSETAVSQTDQEATALIVNNDYIYTTVPPDRDILIGRWHATNKLQPDLDLSVYDASELGVSRLHVALRREPYGWTLTDMNSSNGTWVNGDRLAPFVPYTLKKSNRVLLSNLEVIILLPLERHSQPIL